MLFFDQLIEAALSVLLEGMTKKSQEFSSAPELPKAPKVVSGPKISELKAKVEAEQHALRRLRMCLRDVCNRLDCPCYSHVYWFIFLFNTTAFFFPCGLLHFLLVMLINLVK